MKNYIITLLLLVLGTTGCTHESPKTPPPTMQIKEIKKEREKEDASPQKETPSKLQTACRIDANCTEYISHNTCEVFSANKAKINKEILQKMKITCDSTLWDPGRGENYGCVNKNCQYIKKAEQKIVDSVRLCEIENPRYNPEEECQKVIDQKYADRKCHFEFGATDWMPMGSCRDCHITCE